MNNGDCNVAATTSKLITELRTHRSISLSHYREFCEILKIKYNNDEVEINKNEDDDLDRVIFLGLIQWQKEETGYEIIHAGKSADKRVLRKLGKITYELLKINTYPKIDAVAITAILNKALGVMDKRPTREYRRTLLYYCNVDEEIIDKCNDSGLGELDVSGFVRRVPRKYMIGAAQ